MIFTILAIIFGVLSLSKIIDFLEMPVSNASFFTSLLMSIAYVSLTIVFGIIAKHQLEKRKEYINTAKSLYQNDDEEDEEDIKKEVL